MNRQAITFLSLFSLILVLSVYYVMLPPVGTNETEVTINEQTNEDEEKKDKLQEQLDEQREENIKENENVISSNSSSSDDVSDALEAIDETKAMQSDEKNVKEALKNAGYTETFIEVQKKTIKVTVTKKDASNDDAVAIMNIVLATTDQKYTPEIKFVSD